MEYEDEQQDYSAEQLMLLAENKYKNLKQADGWGNLSEAEVEIVALNAKIDGLKQEGNKKPDRKSKKDENKKQDDNKKEKKKTDKKKTDFRWQKPRTNQMKRMVKGKEYHGLPNHQNETTKEWGQWVHNQLEGCKTQHHKQSNKTSMAKPKQNYSPHYNLTPIWQLSTP